MCAYGPGVIKIHAMSLFDVMFFSAISISDNNRNYCIVRNVKGSKSGGESITVRCGTKAIVTKTWAISVSGGLVR